MKTAKQKHPATEMLPEYHFSGGMRGKYHARYKRGVNVVRLDPDVAKAFPNADSVNRSLRALARMVREAGI
jgi:hypothetical protein